MTHGSLLPRRWGRSSQVDVPAQENKPACKCSVSLLKQRLASWSDGSINREGGEGLRQNPMVHNPFACARRVYTSELMFPVLSVSQSRALVRSLLNEGN